MPPYSVGSFIDKVRCDVLPLKVCHIILRRLWFFDRNVKHCGYTNTYSFKHRDTEMTMVPSKEFPVLKLKKAVDSFLLKCIPQGGYGILSPPPKSTGLSSFKGGNLIQHWCIGWTNITLFGSPRSSPMLDLGRGQSGLGILGFIFHVLGVF